MAIGTRQRLHLAAIVSILAAMGAALIWSTVLVARSLQAFAANTIAAAIAPLLEEIAAVVYWMIIREIAVALVIWATQGPFLTLKWLWLRASVWQIF